MYKCRLCKSDSISVILNLTGFPSAAQKFISDKEIHNDDNSVVLLVRQCNVCNLVQLENEPVLYYKDVITAASLSEASQKNIMNEWLPIIERYKLRTKKIIEIGAGKGDFLCVLDKLDLEISGLENSKINIDASIKNNLNVEQGYLLDANLDNTYRYSLIVCNNYLEHQPNTQDFIRKLNDLLVEDGIIYTSVPNLEYLLAKSCLYEFVADHLVYFTKNTLKLAFEMNGFEVLEEYEKNNGNDLVLIAQKRKVLNLEIENNIVNEIIASVKNYVLNNYIKGKTISIWGAGHRALALMAKADLKEISFVIDSANFKQGLYTPILKKRIISPEEYLNQESDIVIIMLPGSYAVQAIEYLNKNNCKSELLIFEDKAIIN